MTNSSRRSLAWPACAPYTSATNSNHRWYWDFLWKQYQLLTLGSVGSLCLRHETLCSLFHDSWSTMRADSWRRHRTNFRSDQDGVGLFRSQYQAPHPASYTLVPLPHPLPCCTRQRDGWSRPVLFLTLITSHPPTQNLTAAPSVMSFSLVITFPLELIFLSLLFMVHLCPPSIHVFPPVHDTRGIPFLMTVGL